MAWLTSTTVAQTWGICPTCPYFARCRESEFADRPDDAWCRQKEREYAGAESRDEQLKAECLYCLVKCLFLEFNAAKTPVERETRQAELLRLLNSEPGAKAAFDRVAQDIDAQCKAQAEA